ncbi:MAG: 4-(cytidine 5'-diphospho)-2-C-methyl-D-erythritol kinase [Caldisericales bacterium]|nr:4-(cytidine 5'-diphospho)-2-C-methyl-D-erythritol kinase [Caldisericales bacterium]
MLINSRDLPVSFHTRAYAKINWDLHVLARRPDGYHEIDSLVARVDLYDEIDISIGIGRGINVDCEVSPGKDNLAYKAASLLLESFNGNLSVEIKIKKNIPHGAGLGGGSSDAAAVISCLGSFIGLSDTLLLEIAAKVGSDVPSFLFEGWRRMTGRGEIVESMKGFEEEILLVCPDCHVPTPQVYANWDQKPVSTRPGSMSDRLKSPQNDLFEAANLVCPKIGETINALLDHGADIASMSGSGSSVFALFKQKAALLGAALELDKKYTCHRIRIF